jgi:hypothetical protein
VAVTRAYLDALNRGIMAMLERGDPGIPTSFFDTAAAATHHAEENARFSAHGVPLVHPKFTPPPKTVPSPVNITKALLLSVMVHPLRAVHLLKVSPPFIFDPVAHFHGYADKRAQKHFEINYETLQAIVPELCRFFFTEVPAVHRAHHDPFLFSRRALLLSDVSLAIEQFRIRANAVFALYPSPQGCFDGAFPVEVG